MRTWTWVLQTSDFLRKSTVETTTARAVPPSCQWSGLLWKVWQIICTQRTAMWWGLLSCIGDHLYSCWSGGVPLRVGKGSDDRKESLPCVWGMVLPLPRVLSELKAKNIWMVNSRRHQPFSSCCPFFLYFSVFVPILFIFPLLLFLFLSLWSLFSLTLFPFSSAWQFEGGFWNACNPHTYIQVQQRYSVLQKALVEVHRSEYIST